MKKVTWRMTIGFVGAERTGEIEFDDDATDEEIEETVNDDAMQHVDLDWEVEPDA